MNQSNENKARILLGLHSENNLHPVEQAILALGYEVISTHNDVEVMAKAKAADSPQLILLDNHPPVAGRIALVKTLKKDKTTAAIPVVLMTPAAVGTERQQALEAGVDDFLTVPLDQIELQVTLKSLLKVASYAEQLHHQQEEIEDEVSRRTESLRHSLTNAKTISLDTIYRLSQVAEFRDEDTHGHIERLSHYSTALARKLGLDEAFRQNILFASPLHDIGKIAIPNGVLRKPGKLDEEEWKIMRQHSTFGEEILKNSEADFLKMADTIAATHHEKWDGTGYPLGLKGTDIPLAGRIVALADVFDVLTWERPYKQSLPLEKAFAVIREGRGSHFDPDIVDAFFAIQEEIIAEYNWWKFIGSDADSNSTV